MNPSRGSESRTMENPVTVERTSERELVVTRTFDAPARLVFEAWTKPQLFEQWWVPRSMGMKLQSLEMDVRVGGRSLVCMSAPDWGFPALYSTWTYSLVDARNRLEFVHNMSDEHGTTLDMEGIPHDVRHVITFEAVSPEVTRLTVHESSYPTAEARDQSSQGLEECLDKLVAIYA